MSTLAHISLVQYELMVDAGAFSGKCRQRIELIRGELRQMNPIGTWHANIVDLLIEWSGESVAKDQVRIRCQAPLRIPTLDSSPEPDLSLQGAWHLCSFRLAVTRFTVTVRSQPRNRRSGSCWNSGSFVSSVAKTSCNKSEASSALSPFCRAQ